AVGTRDRRAAPASDDRTVADAACRAERPRDRRRAHPSGRGRRARSGDRQSRSCGLPGSRPPRFPSQRAGAPRLQLWTAPVPRADPRAARARGRVPRTVRAVPDARAGGTARRGSSATAQRGIVRRRGAAGDMVMREQSLREVVMPGVGDLLRRPRINFGDEQFLMFVLDKMAYDYEQQYDDVIRLTLGKSELPADASITEAMVKAARAFDKSALVFPAGLPQLREKLAAHESKRHGIAISPDNVIISVGTSTLFR